MAVLKNLRSLSNMQFFKNAWSIRSEIASWIMRDFGLRKNARSVNKIIKDISEEDKILIDSVFEKYGIGKNKQFASQYPEWFILKERDIFIGITQELVDQITHANSIYPRKDCEYERRRLHQHEAIGCCYRLYQELQYFIDIVDTDANFLVDILEKIEREIELLSGWMRSDKEKQNKDK